jgi:hypothetical protein
MINGGTRRCKVPSVVDIVVTKSTEPAQAGQEIHINADENKEGLQEQHPAHRECTTLHPILPVAWRKTLL